MAQCTMAATVGIGLLLVAACERRDGTNDMARGPQTASTDTGMTPGATGTTTTGAAPATVELTDANIVALLDEANRADSAAGAFAARQATSREVKEYARMMMSEHHGLRQQGEQLAKRLGITPKSPDDDPVKAMAQSGMQTLRAAPKGEQFDRTYIEQEIATHRTVLSLAEQSHRAARSPELRAHIEQARPVLEKHLARAEEIRTKLGQTSS
jgi:putative membrane protein